MFLVKRNKSYYLRVRIPLDVVNYFGRCEYVRSLKTGNYKQAKGLAAGLLGKLYGVYTMIRSGVLTDEMIAKMVQTHLETQISFFDKGQNVDHVCNNSEIQQLNDDLHGRITELMQTDDGYKNYLNVHAANINTSKQLLGRRMATKNIYTAEAANLLLRCEGIDKSDLSEIEYSKLCTELMKADVQADSVILEHLRGNYDTDYDREQRNKPKSDRLSDAIAAYISTKTRVKARSKGKYSDTIDKVIECLEIETGQRDIALSEIDYGLTKRIADRLATYPLYRETRHKGQTLTEAMAASNYEQPKPQTLEGDLARLGALYDMALNKFEGLKKDYTKGLIAAVVPDEKKKSSEYRDIYRPADLRSIVSELQRRKDKGEFDENPHLLLVPLIAMYQGFRINEICQLRVEDIGPIDGLWCFSITDEAEGQSVKNNNSRRKNPMHPTLQELGLVRFWQRQKDLGRVRLWEGETKHSCEFYPVQGNHSHYVSKWFNGTFKKRLTLSNPEKQTFHSLRHTFANWFRQNLQMVEHGEAVSALTGHLDKEDKRALEAQGWDLSAENMLTYFKDLNVKRQYETLKRLKYEIDVSGLAI